MSTGQRLLLLKVFFYTFYFFKIIKIEIKSKLPDFSIYFF